MSRRFQFSLKTLFASMAIAAAGFACLASKEDLQFVGIVAGCSAIGAAVGLPFRLAPAFAALGFAVGVVAAYYIITLSIVC
jgi:hypothetical protein